MEILDPKLKDELIAKEENEFDYKGNTGSKKKNFVKKLIDKIFNRDDEDDENEHNTFAL